ncbi:MAG: DNA repair protein RecN [Flavobacteriia bacterium]|jgi:DNA repair protein RecN (Recombination protein N)
MLQALRIRNFALIDRVELNLSGGFTAITGETGSGKSILLSALGLILGERADFSVIGPDNDKAIVEAEFKIASFGLDSFFRENDLDFAPETIIRREISSSGKSRAFINDTPVGLPVLRAFTEQLVNIHSQYNTLELKSRTYQLEVLDLLADLTSKRTDFSNLFDEYQNKNKRLKELKHGLATLLQRQDYNRFQLNELEELELDSRNYSSIEADLRKAENSGDLLQALQALVAVVENDGQIADKIREVRPLLDRMKGVDSRLDELASRIQSVMIELSDVSSDASRMMDGIETDPQKIYDLSKQMDKFNHLLNKHNLQDQEALMGLRDRLEGEVQNLENGENDILQLEDELNHLETNLRQKAADLHTERKKAVGSVSDKIRNILEELKLPNTRLDFSVNEREGFNQYGLSDVTILFSANVGIDSVPIERAASGGELSRVMLALQKLISEKRQFPTVLFDEIDTGVSGDVAQKIGNLLRNMGEHFQLLAITHLPQVAAKASHHMRVEKQLIGNRTVTSVHFLDTNERVEEIARLMSGETITDAAMQNAKALMS